MVRSILFTVFISAVTVSSSFAESINFGSSTGDGKVALNFPGKVFDSSNTFESISQKIKQSKASNDEVFVVSYLESNKQGDKDRILAFWDPADRANIAEMMSDPEAVKANTAFFKNITRSVLMASMQYGDHTLLFVHHTLRGTSTGIPQVYAARKLDDGSLVASNGLADDFFYSRLSDTVAEYLAKETLNLK